MKLTRWRLRRLIFGMSLEDAQSKFDSPESRAALRIAHERHNAGIYHELHIAQKLRNQIAPERKCYISRFTKPSVRGFQAYIKNSPEDYVIKELWADERGHGDQDERANVEIKGTASSAVGTSDSISPARNDVAGAVSSKISSERELFKVQRETVISALSDALENICENVHSELTGRRLGGTLVSSQQPSVVDRLVGEVSEASDKGYKSLSSSSHLLEPVEMAVALYGKKDKGISDAFKSTLLRFPAREGDISYSLWVSGGCIANERLCAEFPFHIAKYVVSDTAELNNSNRIPCVDVEIYFSPELYQLQKSIGRAGITAVRHFIGKIMMKQHEPTPISPSLLLNASPVDRELYNIFNASANESIQIPWINKTRTKVATLTGIVLSSEQTEDSSTTDAMKEAISAVWKAWGHLVKDLHVHGDLDFLYITIDRHKEASESSESIAELKLVEEKRDKIQEEALREASLLPSSNDLSEPKKRRTHQKPVAPSKPLYVPIVADFTVIECCLEKKGLPHNMVVEDIVQTLRDMQNQSLEMLRLSLISELEDLAEDEVGKVIPVLYAPKVVVTHSGVIESGTHSFQRIRIRGSHLAHVEAFARALESGDHFTDRSFSSVKPSSTHHDFSLPPNLSFSPTLSPTAELAQQGTRRLLGHRLPGPVAMSSDGRIKRNQTTQAFEFMTVTDDERSFWRENYYKISDLKLIFHDRVEPEDVTKPHLVSPRLQEHIRAVQAKLGGDGNDSENTGLITDGVSEGGGNRSDTSSGRKSSRSQKKKKSKKMKANHSTPLPEKMFEYLCTDMEADAAGYDLRVGDCDGYEYGVTLRKIPSRDWSCVQPAVISLQAKGFINYFGPSRFATYTKMNMHPGLHLLKGEFRAAAHVIVQQFYLDAAVEAEKKRTGSAFPKSLQLNGSGFRLPDFSHLQRRRSVAEHGSALQRVLNNALQATALLGGDLEEDAALEGMQDRRRGEGGAGNAIKKSSSHPSRSVVTSDSVLDLEDPCVDAFMNVVGPNACRILIQEFLSFVWNDVVNQRLQRYGTFAVLPGDLVRQHSLAASHPGSCLGNLAVASRADVQRGRYSALDVVLPIPGAGVQLPQNHTADLYVVTLKRYGLVFDSEARRWNCFYGSLGSEVESPSATSEATSSPYRALSSSFALMEEELGGLTPFTGPLDPREGGRALGVPGQLLDGLDGDASGEPRVGSDTFMVRPDLQSQGPNPLHLTIAAGYRHPIVNPSETLRWSAGSGVVGDPQQRWGASLAQVFVMPEISQTGVAGRSDAAQTCGSAASKRAGPTPTIPQFLEPAPLPHSSRQRSVVGRPRRVLPLPRMPYWMSERNDGWLHLRFRFPSGVYPSMMLRELTKLDVNTPDVVDIHRPASSIRPKAWDELTTDQQVTYRKYLATRRRRTFRNRPQAINLALLHQQIFRSGGVRHSLIPTLRSYDSVSK